MDVRCARLYRLLHGAPMLGGVPVHYALALLGLVFVGGFGGMLVSDFVGAVAAIAVVIAWGVLTFIYRLDRVAVPLFALRLRYRFPSVVSSFTPSGRKVFVREHE